MTRSVMLVTGNASLEQFLGSVLSKLGWDLAPVTNPGEAHIVQFHRPADVAIIDLDCAGAHNAARRLRIPKIGFASLADPNGSTISPDVIERDFSLQVCIPADESPDQASTLIANCLRRYEASAAT